MLKLALHTLSLPCVCPVFPSFQAIMDFAGKYGSVDLATLDFTLRCQSCDDWESAIRQQHALFERAGPPRHKVGDSFEQTIPDQ